ncbi:MAG: TetR/AcrR family transcriptional regulator [Sedimentibacter sp.]|uniref:TetR/AcrR family transcriptional regulator n=1 Tax=Sedimentibacter sp. TaxID=1960295 RepID=UPI0031593A32
MGVNERREKERLIRRNDILDAAENVIFSKGYDLATMDDIAKEAEFSKRTVYMYFNSKEQLYFEIMVRGYKILIQMVEASLNDVKGKNALERIKQIGKTLYDFKNEYPDYFKAIMSYENGEKDFVNGVPDESREECYKLGEEIFGYLTSELTEGIREGIIRSELDVTNTAILLWSCVLGLLNTLTKKRNYIEHYHKRDSEELLLQSLEFLVISITNNTREEKNAK